MSTFEVRMNTCIRSFDLPADLSVCPHGHRLIGENHFRRRNNELVGSVIRCNHPECTHYKEGFLGYHDEDVIRKYRKYIATPP